MKDVDEGFVFGIDAVMGIRVAEKFVGLTFADDGGAVVKLVVIEELGHDGEFEFIVVFEIKVDGIVDDGGRAASLMGMETLVVAVPATFARLAFGAEVVVPAVFAATLARVGFDGVEVEVLPVNGAAR